MLDDKLLGAEPGKREVGLVAGDLGSVSWVLQRKYVLGCESAPSLARPEQTLDEQVYYTPRCLVLVRALLALGPANGAPTAGRDNCLPVVLPIPKEIYSYGKGVSLVRGTVTIVTGNATDSATIDTIKAIVSSAGGSAVVSAEPTGHGTQIVIGTGSENGNAAAFHAQFERLLDRDFIALLRRCATVAVPNESDRSSCLLLWIHRSAGVLRFRKSAVSSSAIG